MSLRQITVVSSTRSTPKVFHSEATTWGQLKETIESDFGSIDNMRVVVKETRATLELSEAVLPTTDFTLFLSAKQIKAGGTDVVAVLRELKNRFSSSIDEIIEEINDGDYQKTSAPISRTSQPSIKQEDADFLARLSSGRI